jgi:alpha-amylase/alpha-mannosidase (GH57 family)
MNWLQQQAKALRRDKYTCQRCGKTKEQLGYLDVHHIVPVFNFPDRTEAHALTNLLCLCKRCHKAAESFSSLFFAGKGEMSTDVLSEEIQVMLRDLKAWADKEYGRKAQIARALKVSRGRVGDWLEGRIIPNTKNFLALRKFLAKRK